MDWFGGGVLMECFQKRVYDTAMLLQCQLLVLVWRGSSVSREMSLPKSVIVSPLRLSRTQCSTNVGVPVEEILSPTLWRLLCLRSTKRMTAMLKVNLMKEIMNSRPGWLYGWRRRIWVWRQSNYFQKNCESLQDVALGCLQLNVRLHYFRLIPHV